MKVAFFLLLAFAPFILIGVCLLFSDDPYDSPAQKDRARWMKGGRGR